MYMYINIVLLYCGFIDKRVSYSIEFTVVEVLLMMPMERNFCNDIIIEVILSYDSARIRRSISFAIYYTVVLLIKFSIHHMSYHL